MGDRERQISAFKRNLVLLRDTEGQEETPVAVRLRSKSVLGNATSLGAEKEAQSIRPQHAQSATLSHHQALLRLQDRDPAKDLCLLNRRRVASEGLKTR